MDNSTQPTVLVKKADGTMARMTLDEVKQMRAGGADAKSAVTAMLPAEEKRPVLIPKVENNWTPDDHKSLMDPSFHNMLPMVEPSTVIATSTPVGKVFLNEAAAATLRMPFNENKIKTSQIPDSIPISSGQIPNSTNAKDEFVKKWTTNENMWQVPEAPPQPKLTLSDVIPSPLPHNMNQVDELRAFTITDFRRLAMNVAQAVPTLLDKFKVLKEESYLSYLDGFDAWISSPLYQTYLNLAADALKNKKSLELVLSEQADKTIALRMEEWKAVGSINKQLT